MGQVLQHLDEIAQSLEHVLGLSGRYLADLLLAPVYYNLSEFVGLVEQTVVLGLNLLLRQVNVHEPIEANLAALLLLIQIVKLALLLFIVFSNFFVVLCLL